MLSPRPSWKTSSLQWAEPHAERESYWLSESGYPETGVARVRSMKPIHIPRGTVKLVAATCSPHFGAAPAVLSELGSGSLPNGYPNGY